MALKLPSNLKMHTRTALTHSLVNQVYALMLCAACSKNSTLCATDEKPVISEKLQLAREQQAAQMGVTGTKLEEAGPTVEEPETDDEDVEELPELSGGPNRLGMHADGVSMSASAQDMARVPGLWGCTLLTKSGSYQCRTYDTGTKDQ